MLPNALIQSYTDHNKDSLINGRSTQSKVLLFLSRHVLDKTDNFYTPVIWNLPCQQANI